MPDTMTRGPFADSPSTAQTWREPDDVFSLDPPQERTQDTEPRPRRVTTSDRSLEPTQARRKYFQALEEMLGALRALDQAHADLTPRNIGGTEGFGHLIDFGLLVLADSRPGTEDALSPKGLFTGAHNTRQLFTQKIELRTRRLPRLKQRVIIGRQPDHDDE